VGNVVPGGNVRERLEGISLEKFPSTANPILMGAVDQSCRPFKEVFTVDANNVLEDDHQENVQQQSDQLQNVKFTTESV